MSNDKNCRHWRRSPSKSHIAASPSGRKLCGVLAPSCWSACRQRYCVVARRAARCSFKTPNVIVRPRYLHQSDSTACEPKSTACQSKCHPHQGACSRPIDQPLSTADQKALIGYLGMRRRKIGIIVAVVGQVSQLALRAAAFLWNSHCSPFCGLTVGWRNFLHRILQWTIVPRPPCG
jgi:hypothetical protein